MLAAWAGPFGAEGFEKELLVERQELVFILANSAAGQTWVMPPSTTSSTPVI
jgi:hypothetical protein